MSNFIKDFFKHYPRSGKLFRKYLKELEETEKYSLQELQEYQNEKLSKTIKIAYENVPYYRRIFKERKLTPQDIKKAEDLQKLPVIDKQTIRENFKDFRNKNFKGLVFKGHTSGSSGTPGVFLRDLYSINYEKASLWRQYRWARKSLESKRVILRGDLIIVSEKDKPPFWKYNPFSKELVMSSYHLSDKNMRYYVEEIKRFNPFDLYAYPSTAYLLANYCKRNSVNLSFPCVFTSAETVFDYQREEIENVFKCKLFDQYGSAERIVNIAQCEYGTYHEIPDYSIVEYIPAGQGQYEIVGTTLFNSIMPLIRYKLGDLIELNEDNNCSCGRNFRVIKKIIGRNDDIIVLKNGRKLGSVYHVFYDLDFLKEAQIIQHSLEEIEIKIVPLRNITKKERKILIERTYEYIGKSFNYKIIQVEHIARGPNGKFKLVKNMMNKGNPE